MCILRIEINNNKVKQKKKQTNEKINNTKFHKYGLDTIVKKVEKSKKG